MSLFVKYVYNIVTCSHYDHFMIFHVFSNNSTKKQKWKVSKILNEDDFDGFNEYTTITTFLQ